ncbi:hypothetical protein IBB80_02330 [Listeria marthii]|nr:hypothetical protein [Listeria marthii]MBF2674092.1 hypothetical protein [Listeria marthii]
MGSEIRVTSLDVKSLFSIDGEGVFYDYQFTQNSHKKHFFTIIQGISIK